MIFHIGDKGRCINPEVSTVYEIREALAKLVKKTCTVSETSKNWHGIGLIKLKEIEHPFGKDFMWIGEAFTLVNDDFVLEEIRE